MTSEHIMGTCIENWQQRNRQASTHRSHLPRITLEKLFSERDDLLATLEWWRAYYPFVRPHTMLRVALV